MTSSAEEVRVIIAECENLIQGPGCIYPVRVYEGTTDYMVCRAIGSTVRIIQLHINWTVCSLENFEKLLRQSVQHVNELQE